MKKTFIGLALFVAAIAVGCGSQVVEFPVDPAVVDGGTPTDDGPTTELCVDSNCPVGQVCQDNVCTQVDPCAGVSCPEGSVCSNGTCTPVDPCAGVTCPEGVQCVDGACPSQPDAGSPDAGEPDSGTPDSGTPEAGPPKDPCDGVCCPHDKLCKEGRCVPKDPCAGVQCPESRVCKGGQCVCDGDEGDRCGHNKTLICHKDCKGKRHNICVSDNAVPAHKRHGDKVGDCSVCR